MSDSHPTQWSALRNAVLHDRLPSASFFVGPLHCHLADFTLRVSQLLLCKSHDKQRPCMTCPDCQMVQRMEHPDIEWVKPEKSGSAIKVDQIRELQKSAFLTPQRGGKGLIVIEGADRMNTAASNALLKILEEPASHTLFILIAEQLSTVLPTILSRCQRTHFTSDSDVFLDNLLLLGDLYPEASQRATLARESETLLDELIALIEKKQHPCFLAAQWNKFDFGDLLWFLYLVYSQVYYVHIKDLPPQSRAYSQLMKLKSLLNPIVIFAQLDKINNILKKLSHNMNMNQLLALEDLLCIDERV
jgi:DNA polymerase-3 subunit delta'